MFLFKLDRFIPISKLKYYFAVDTLYVGKKLGLVVFPYMHEVSLFLVYEKSISFVSLIFSFVTLRCFFFLIFTEI